MLTPGGLAGQRRRPAGGGRVTVGALSKAGSGGDLGRGLVAAEEAAEVAAGEGLRVCRDAGEGGGE